jgi:AcrR family transcriptional regulator
MAIRKYDSSRRAASAERTRQAIVDAAVKLHGQGNMALTALADEANVSLATVNKYFPTREDLFAACTSHHKTLLTFPEPDELAAIPDAGERLYQTVRAVYSLHEQAFGHLWSGYKLADESPVLAKTVSDAETFINRLVDEVLLEPVSGPVSAQTVGFVRAMLSPLTYRALRLQGALEHEAAVESTASSLALVLNVDLPATIPFSTTL